MDSRTKEFAWVAKLSSENKVKKWSGMEDGTLEQIVLKMAVLGPGAKKGERNLVEVTTFDSEQKKTKACICALGVGTNENQQLADIALFPPANFTLIEGSGPVHIFANHMLLDEDDLSDEEDMSDFEEEMEDVKDLKTKLNSSKSGSNGKGEGQRAIKMIKGEDSVADDWGDDDLDEDEEDSLEGEESIDLEGDEDDDDSEGDDDEEPAEAPTKKRKLMNGKAKNGKPELKTESPVKGKRPAKEQPKTPTSQKSAGPKTPKEAKTPISQKTADSKTPKSEKKTPSKPKFSSVEDVKAVISKHPGGKPRKQDKFFNWLENQFKITEKTWKDDLWMWHKKQQGL